MNCDEAVDGDDIAPFVLALLDPTAYATAYPGCPRMHADCDGNGLVEAADVDSFVARLIGL